MSGRDVLRGTVRGQGRRVGVAAVLGCVHQLGEAMTPVLIGVVIDQAVAGRDGGRLVLWLVVLAVVYVCLSWSFRLGALAGERSAEEAGHVLRLAVVRRVLDARGGAESDRLSGELANVATEDAKRVGAVTMALMNGIWALAGITVSAVALLLTSVPLGLVVLLGTPVLLWLGHLLSKPLERRSEAEQDQAAGAAGVAADLVAGLRVLRGLGAQGAAVERYRRTSRVSLVATLRAARAESWQSGLVLALTGCFLALIAWVGGRLALDGSLSLGQLVSAVGLALFLVGPLETFAWVNAELAQGRASAARIAKVLGAGPAVAGGEEPVPADARGELRLNGVRLRGLDGVDLRVPAGRLTGIAVSDPALADALLDCLGREADPEAGAVELDGVPLTRVDPAALRAAVLVARHDAALFEGSLAANVVAAGEDPDGVAAGPAMAAADADEVARALPYGAGTDVGEGGRSLSGGQRQRVLLARALHAAPPVLVVHDPTTAVDAATEARIARGLGDFRRGRTTVVVTNSPALLAVTDHVVFLDGGRVGAEGTHEELARTHETYRGTVWA
ncbi:MULTISPECIES: ABC transporter ATP-binding protein [unclassified Streptomyces]|uniref:ABC transporter ATP-binding protein n=1 Tax=unclassified Streptomyces TaxID=2593676 RepID=UPI000B84D6F4|nr:ABC transporter ATP-binding protein [Streptomyces sp. LcepLS]MYR26909.1 ATP-binding cassette domain-containing protein [Streptomyces sp. SID4945]